MCVTETYLLPCVYGVWFLFSVSHEFCSHSCGCMPFLLVYNTIGSLVWIQMMWCIPCDYGGPYEYMMPSTFSGDMEEYVVCLMEYLVWFCNCAVYSLEIPAVPVMEVLWCGGADTVLSCLLCSGGGSGRTPSIWCYSWRCSVGGGSSESILLCFDGRALEMIFGEGCLLHLHIFAVVWNAATPPHSHFHARILPPAGFRPTILRFVMNAFCWCLLCLCSAFSGLLRWVEFLLLFNAYIALVSTSYGTAVVTTCVNTRLLFFPSPFACSSLFFCHTFLIYHVRWNTDLSSVCMVEFQHSWWFTCISPAFCLTYLTCMVANAGWNCMPQTVMELRLIFLGWMLSV